MITIIAHRGNISGPKQKFENNPEYIMEAVKNGFDVEIDVWYKNKNYYLGHDEPQYHVTKKFLLSLPAWCHAKNIDAMEQLKEDGLHYFWHQMDQYTLTSKGIPWCYPNNYNKYGVTVALGKDDININEFRGIGLCTDYCLIYKNKYE